MNVAAEIKRVAKLTGTFQLRSGALSDVYFDKYQFESHPQLLKAIAQQLGWASFQIKGSRLQIPNARTLNYPPALRGQTPAVPAGSPVWVEQSHKGKSRLTRGQLHRK